MENEIKRILLANGADVCGIAGEERFSVFPEGFSPRDIFPDCRSVISFGAAIPRGLYDVSPRLVYGAFNTLTSNETDKTALFCAKEIERRFSCRAVPMPSDGPYEYWDAEQKKGKGLVSVKDAAVAAGLGQLGKSELLLNPVYGNTLAIGLILCDLPLRSDVPSESVCIDGCKKCIESCPVGAIREGEVVQKLCRENSYGKNARGFDTVNCNRCRTVCPVRFGKPKTAKL